jgi:8-amino-7-oxononanoate synthase
VRGDITNLERRLDGLLQDRKGKGRYRQIREYDPDSTLVDFVRSIQSSTADNQSSNDYLSLTDSASLRSTFLHNLEQSPRILGSTGSRLLSGSTSEHTALENRFRQFFDSPSALLFNSGWDANVSFFATVPQPGDWVIYDELIHASVHSGLRASRVDPKRRLSFRHNDPHGLGEVLSRIDKQGTVFLAVESLYSMDGDFAPLPSLLDVMDKFVERERQCVVVDEAHSTGVYGSQGRGITHALQEQRRVDIRLMTFGKAVGSSGGESARC